MLQPLSVGFRTKGNKHEPAMLMLGINDYDADGNAALDVVAGDVVISRYTHPCSCVCVRDSSVCGRRAVQFMFSLGGS